MTKQELNDFIEDEFSTIADNPFSDFGSYSVYRHKNNNKWFALLMNVPIKKLKGKGEEMVDVVNLKCDPLLRAPLIEKKGIYTAYHMSKTHWISVLLSEASDEDIKTLVSISFDLTKKRIK